MNTHDKIILEAAKALLDRRPLASLKREGKKSCAFGDAFDSTLSLLEALDDSSTKVSEIKRLTVEKKVAIDELKKYGIIWPL
tara:strand:- start:281 stop:526 length:246 start_codon:yes stop_codon:yes gene_type:complete